MSEVFHRGFERFVPVALLEKKGDRHVLNRRQSWKEMVILKHESDPVQPELGDRIFAELPDVGSFDLDGACIGLQNP